MTISDSKLAYLDCYKILDAAIDATGGCRVHVVDENAAIHLRMRLHQARKIERRENRKVYERDHPQHGASVYDGLIVRIKIIDEEAWVYVEKNTAAILAIESIDQLHQIEDRTTKQITQEPQRLLEPPKLRRRV